MVPRALRCAWLAALGWLVCLGGCAGRAPERPPAVGEYTVVSGDTLSEIAARFGVSVEALTRANAVGDPRRLQIGTVLTIPPADAEGGFALTSLAREIPPLAHAPRIDLAVLRERLASLVTPVEGARLTSRFGWRFLRFHEGIDLSAPAGTPIRAALDGVVVYSGAGINGYGNTVILRHDDFITVYAHNTANTVAVGEEVRAGETIGTVGKTGRASGPHCHFEIRVRDEAGHFVAVDPLPFFPVRASG